MAQDYFKVLKALKVELQVICRTDKSASHFYEKTGVRPTTDNLSSHLRTHINYEAAIVAVNIENLFDVTHELIVGGIKKILLEKPGALESSQLRILETLCDKHEAEVFIAYNRRFYTSTQELKKLIEQEGGIQSLDFEFTEPLKEIRQSNHSSRVKEDWLIANSSHVIDLGFYLAGKPLQYEVYSKGKINNYERNSIFAGAGQLINGGVFTFKANWNLGGRWHVEICTPLNRYLLKPLETLKRYEVSQHEFTPIKIDDTVDKEYKPGLYCQVSKFLNYDLDDLCKLSHQIWQFSFYNKLAG